MRFALLSLLVTAYGVFRAQRNAEAFDVTFSALLASVIIAWLSASQVLLRFIDHHNRSRRIYGLAGFLALLAAILAIEWLAFRVKIAFGLVPDASASFQSDSVWLVLFPMVAYYASSRKKFTPMPGAHQSSPVLRAPRVPHP